MKMNRWAAVLITGILCMIIPAWPAFAGTAAPEDKAAVSDAQEPAEAPEEDYGFISLTDFTADTLDGGSFGPEDLAKYDLTIVYFWSATCGYCVEELPELAELKQELPSNIQLITWCPDGGVYRETVQKMLDRRGLDAVTIISGEGDLDLLIRQLLYTPMTVFMDSKGCVVNEPLIGAQEDLVTVYNETIDEILGRLGLTRADAETEEKPEE